jgi:amino acid adenylation domain-containing protein
MDISRLLSLSEDEIDELNSFQHTETPFSKDELIDNLIVNAALDLSKTACVYNEVSISREIFLEQVRLLTGLLQKKGVSHGNIVGVAMQPGHLRLVSVLAILQCGAVLLPLDPGLPKERLHFFIEDSGATLILINNNDGLSLQTNVETFKIAFPIQDHQHKIEPVENRKSTDAAYIIYTSGSTGKPKACINTHRSIINRIEWMSNNLAVSPEDCFCHKTSFGFDVSIWEQLLPLLAGAKVIIAKEGINGDANALASLVIKHKITLIHYVPTLLSAFLESQSATQCTSIRAIVASGEALPKSTASLCVEKLNVDLYNYYGPSEAAIDVTSWCFDLNETRNFVPIGKPIQNVKIYILDENLERVPIGSQGNLFIGGEAIGRGYINRPSLTADKFIPDPFSEIPGSRLYNTGDLACFHEEGVIEFRGRSDFQIKLRGFRIEIGEIEENIRKLTEVQHCVVTARRMPSGNHQLNAYLRSDQDISIEELQANLKSLLPEYMVPLHYFVLATFPVTTNGKLDRSALPLLPVTGNSTTLEPPKGAVEEILAKVWSSLLNYEIKDRNANFFKIGGDSILAIRMVARAYSFGLQFEVKDVFDHPVLSKLAAHALLPDKTPKPNKRSQLLWKSASANLIAVAAPVMIIPAEKLPFTALKNIKHEVSFVICKELDAKSFFYENLNPDYSLNEVIAELFRILSNDIELCFAATSVQLKNTNLTILALHPAVADVTSLQQLTAFFQSTQEDKNLFLNSEGESFPGNSTLNIDKLAVPGHLPVKFSQKVISLFDKSLSLDDTSPLSLQRKREAVMLLVIRKLFTQTTKNTLLISVADGQCFKSPVKHPLQAAQIRSAIPIQVKVTRDEVMADNGFRWLAQVLKNDNDYSVQEDALRIRFLFMPEEVSSLYTDGITEIIKAKAREKEITVMIQHNKLCWYWDKRIGSFPIDIASQLTSINTSLFVQRARKMRFQEDFPIAKIDQEQLETLNAADTIIEDIYPLSPLQEGLLMRTKYWPESDAYLNQNVIEVRGKLSAGYIQKAWEATVDKYEILRSGYIWKTSSFPLQYVAQNPIRQMVIEDWSIDGATNDLEIEKRMEAYLAKDRDQPFDMEEAGLFRLLLARIDDNRHLLIWTHHHILLDGWCLALVWGDVFRYYNHLVAGRKTERLRPRPYRDYIEWLNNNSPTAQDHLYWEQTLSNFSTPTNFSSNPMAEEGTFETLRLSLDDTVFHQLKQATANNAITPNVYVQATWALLLGIYNNTLDVIHGVSVSGRPPRLIGSENMVGLFINTIPLRTKIKASQNLNTLLQSVQKNLVLANNHSRLALSDILGKWKGRINQEQLLFDNLIAFENYPDEYLPDEENEGVSFHDKFCNEKTEYPFGLIVLPGPPMEFHFNYDASQFTKNHVETIAKDFFALFERFIKHPDQKVNSLFLPSMEVVLSKYKNTKTSISIKNTNILDELLTVFERHATKTAIVTKKGAVTYSELKQKISALNGCINNATEEKLVAICSERSEFYITCLLSVWFTGRIPVLLNPSLPDNLIIQALNRLDTPFMLVDSQHKNRIEQFHSKLIHATIDQLSEESLIHGSLPITSVVLLSSGTSGTPKMIMLSWDGLTQRIKATQEIYEMSNPVLLANAAPGFDIGIWEILFTLVQGGKLIIADSEEVKDPRIFCQLLEDYKINTIHLTPSFAETLLQSNKPNSFIDIELMITGGETVRPAYIKKLQKVMPKASIWQGYGPSETSITVTDHLIVSSDVNKQYIPLGKPLKGSKVYILDKFLRPCPDGTAGMLYIAGMALGMGYYKKPGQTAAAFLPNPFGDDGSRMYYTGDLVKRSKNGEIEFQGRADRQAKVRGHRIEPELIEQILCNYHLVDKAVVLVHSDDKEENQIIAFVTTVKEMPAKQELPNILNNWIKEHLPTWYCPSIITICKEFPITTNGKIDADRLLNEMDKNALKPEDVKEAPLTKMEELIYEAWKSVLGRLPENRHAHFFTSGGHSLSAMRFAIQLEELIGFNASVPVPLLFKYPTPSSFAEAITSPVEGSGASNIFTISKGSGAPLVLIHPVEGISFSYNALRDLIPNRTIIAINNPRIGKKEGFGSLREMALLYIEWVRGLIGDVPVILGGWSFGGVVALEMANIMKVHGEVPLSILLIDSYNFSGRYDLDMSGDYAIARLQEKNKELGPELTDALAKEIKRSLLLVLSQKEAYYPYPVCLLQSNDQDPTLRSDIGINNGWNPEMLPLLSKIAIQGKHEDLFRPPYLISLAKTLIRSIDQIDPLN